MLRIIPLIVSLAIVYQAHSASTTSKCLNRNPFKPLVADETDPHKYHVCRGSVDVATMTCPLGTVFSEADQICAHENSVDDICKQHPTAHLKNPKDSHSFYVCMDGKAYLFQCAPGLVYSEQYQVCVWPNQFH